MESRQWIDEHNHIHINDERLGAGGQGVVYRTLDPNIALKLVTDQNGNPVTNRDACERYRKKFKQVQLLPLPQGIRVALPSALLKGYAGYVMTLLTEMVPFSHFWLGEKAARRIRAEDIPAWLDEMPEEQAKHLMHYANTGGLKRRLTALARCADVLSRLHVAGLVYGDISPNNVFLSSDPSSSEVWLIDADNLRYDPDPRGSSVYTPGYGAPEVMQERDRTRFRSDCHAFAVLAFRMLTFNHPFLGDYVKGGDWADDEGDPSGTREERAYAGLIPWIYEADDDSNRTEDGLPAELVLTEPLVALFDETFGAGRTQFWRRPSIFHWPEALAAAADETIECSACRMSWYMDKHGSRCPYCDTAAPPHLAVRVYSWDGGAIDEGSPEWTYFSRLPSVDDQLALPERLFKPFDGEHGFRTAVTLTMDERSIVLKAEDPGSLELYVAFPNERGEQFQRIHSSVQLPADVRRTGFWLASGGVEPRVISFGITMEEDAWS
ncbi:protein kinase domain-containing protein [Paenibacillus sabinae]|uniref:Protein kinase n=1 Tax=Paenibacillus sabinae T27 TaxID=1268072 RepID=X4ZTA5_9BACL|nr:hypothetical protein [Paenibacillus sabinae]AHV95633.1 protein kinase [Paenibacillus sabinae T27]